MLSRPSTSRARRVAARAPEGAFQPTKQPKFVESPVADPSARFDPPRDTLPVVKRALKARPTADHAEISAETPDWSREACKASQWFPSRQLIRAIRDYQTARQTPGMRAIAQAKIAVLRHRFWSVVCAADIPLNSQLGGGLVLPHPNGVVVHPAASIGPNCMLFQQVTIGSGPKPGVPTLGGHVDVGAGARILGGVRIGDHVVIGANAIVVSDVPSGVSVPALIKY